ncbi:hypothetical protein AAG747_21735 [Rapidithrix thailandica]|uniref:Uncharacterized protein n=1 Tax=Rapidithrix thailandica TaxID=413964 RepID=A0AAW9S070_9BACT
MIINDDFFIRKSIYYLLLLQLHVSCNNCDVNSNVEKYDVPFSYNESQEEFEVVIDSICYNGNSYKIIRSSKVPFLSIDSVLVKKCNNNSLIIGYFEDEVFFSSELDLSDMKIGEDLYNEELPITYPNVVTYEGISIDKVSGDSIYTLSFIERIFGIYKIRIFFDKNLRIKKIIEEDLSDDSTKIFL